MRLIIKVYIIERRTRVKLLNVLRQVLFDIRARNSVLVKSHGGKSNHAMYQD